MYKLIIFLLLLILTPLFAQNNPEFTKEHRQLEAERKAMAHEKALLQGTMLNIDPGRGFDVNYYGLTLNIFPAATDMNGILNVKAVVTDQALEEVWLDFSSYMIVDTVTGSADDLLTFTHSAGRLTVNLERIYTVDENLSLMIYYHGKTDFGGQSVFGTSFGHTQVFGKDHIWSLSEPYGARDWWPCKDTPLDKADSMDIYYTVPEGMIAVANGNLISELTDNNRTTFHWKITYPIATYLVSIAAYNYLNFEDTYISQSGDTLPVTFFIAPENDNVVLRERFGLVSPMISAFSDMFGEYPFMDEKYGHAEAAIGGGMEHQTITTLGPMGTSGGFYSEALIAHELAHQWWGDMITCASFRDIWLNEGFASYSEALWVEYMYGYESYKSYITNDAYYGGGTIIVDDTTDSGRIFNGNLSYSKASYVLHMLRGVVGDETFFDILTAWYDNPDTRYGSAYTKDFQQVCEQVSGLNLEKFFQQWIYNAYFPVYSWSYKVKESTDGYDVMLYIDQNQDNAGLFWMPIDVRIIMESDTANFVAWDSLASQQFLFTVENEPLQVQFDPDNWILKEAHKGLYNPALDQGTLMVNGMDWAITGVWDSYQNNAFWGPAPITFWDILSEPAAGYPETLPEPLGNGELTIQTLAQYSTVIWLSGNTSADKTNWNNLLLFDYLQAGGNIIFLSHSGADFLDNQLKEYLGISWDEQENLLIQDFTSTFSGIWDIALYNNMSEVTCFDTVLTRENSFLLFEAEVEFEVPKGVGVWSDNNTTGDFVFLAAQPWILNHSHLRKNMLYILENFMNEAVASLDNPFESSIPLAFNINRIYPNPFNPSTHIEFSLPRQQKISITIYNILGKQVAQLASDEIYQAGSHIIQWQADNLASGIYFIQLQSAGNLITKKAVLMK